MPDNPFQYLLPVKPRDFVGRWEDVHRIASNLCENGGKSYAIISGRRCGKTSFLRALQHELTNITEGDISEVQFLPIFFDFKSQSFDSEEGFLAHILKEIRRHVDCSVHRRPTYAWQIPVTLDDVGFQTSINASRLSLQDFQDGTSYVLESISAPFTPAKLVLLLDEVDAILETSWVKELFDRLRSLCMGELQGQVHLVIAGSRKFLRLGEKGSPLFNILEREFLTSFNQDRIIELMNRIPDIPESVKNEIWQQSGGHPFLAQYLLHHLVEQYSLDQINHSLPIDIHNLTSKFTSTHMEDLETWTKSLEQTGLHSFKILCHEYRWFSTEEVSTKLNFLERLEIERGLMALSYHGLAQHDHWTQYRHSGELFKKWFGLNYKSLIAEGIRNPTLEAQENSSTISQVVNYGTYIEGDVEPGKDFIGRDIIQGDEIQHVNIEHPTQMAGGVSEVDIPEVEPHVKSEKLLYFDSALKNIIQEHWFRSVIAGIVTGLVAHILIPEEYSNWRLSMVVGVIATLFLLNRNPKYHYRRLTWSLLGLLTAWNAVPNIEMLANHFGESTTTMSLRLEGFTWPVNVSLMILMAVTMFFDHQETKLRTGNRDKDDLQR